MASRQTEKPLQEQLREVERQLLSFVEDGDLDRDRADEILEHLRKSIKAFRADKK